MLPATFSAPLVDEHPANPFYVPELPAASYMNILRRRLDKKARSKRTAAFPGDRLLHSFASTLDKALVAGDHHSDSLCQDRDVIGSRQLSTSPKLLGLPFSGGWDTLSSLPELEPSYSALGVGGGLPVKRIRSPSSCSFSDIDRPAKHARSLLSFHDSSFEVTVKRERLNYFTSNAGYSPQQRLPPRGTIAPAPDEDVPAHLNRRIQDLEDELYGPRIGTESPDDINHFIAWLDSSLPGIRLEARLSRLDPPTHQKIADVLAENGLLNARVLNAFRSTEIKSLSLSASLVDQDGLNMLGRNSLRVFSAPNSFLFLSRLSFNNTPIWDSDLNHIHHLPNLAYLFLEETGIGNEAMFILVSLKRSLYYLDICANPRIDDTAVPALLLLSRLSVLLFLGTNIGMNGLYLFATVLSRERRHIRLEIPPECERYLDTMHQRYLVQPLPPLITEPAMCFHLSMAALQHNLAEHAVCNPDILTTGSRAELIERLQMILENRKMDLLVNNMIWGVAPSDSDSSDE